MLYVQLKKTWEDVDWVELGCRGWEIDESGAELADHNDDWNGAHLDFETLHLILSGDADFIERAIRDLRCANVLTPPWAYATIGTSSSTTAMVWVA